MVPNIILKLSNVYFIFEYEHLKRFCLKIYHFRLYSEDLESVTFSELAEIDAFCKGTIVEKRNLPHISSLQEYESIISQPKRHD